MNAGDLVLCILPLPGALECWGRECQVIGRHAKLSADLGQPIYMARCRTGRMVLGPARAFLQLDPRAIAARLILGKL